MRWLRLDTVLDMLGADTTAKRRALVWLVRGLAVTAVVTLLTTTFLVLHGETLGHAVRATAPAHVTRLRSTGFEDSWMPMLKAYRAKQETPERSIYLVFFEKKAKFQYPPTALLILDLVPARILDADTEPVSRAFVRLLAWPSRLLALAAIAFSAGIVVHGVRRLSPERLRRSYEWALGGLLVVLGLGYYPLLKAVEIGQIQILVDACIAASVFCYATGRERASGVLLGVCCLIKPQYALLLVWALLRRRFRFLGPALLVLVSGLAASVWRFGLTDHLDYLGVLGFIARHGEAYGPNQSVNGVVQRLIGNGDARWFSDFEFPPYHAGVHALTLASSILLLGLALWPRKLKTSQDNLVDLLVALVAATIASPVAWEHHFGALLPVYGATLPLVLARASSAGVAAGLLAGSFVGAASTVARPDLMYLSGPAGLLGAHLFFSGVVLFGLLVWLRRDAARALPPLS